MMVRTLKPWRNTTLRPFDDLYREMDSLVGHLLRNENAESGAEHFAPRLNIAETEAQFEVSVDLPGVNPENVNVEVHEGALTINGTRESETAESGKTYHRIERRYGEFRRVIPLPDAVDEDRITADYSDGVLSVVLPKSEKLKPTRIEVRKSNE